MDRMSASLVETIPAVSVQREGSDGFFQKEQGAFFLKQGYSEGKNGLWEQVSLPPREWIRNAKSLSGHIPE
jgi:hypothetical protein